jgi:hypothetical protein
MKTNLCNRLLLIVVLAIASPTISYATEPASTTVEYREEKANRLKNRLEEIRGIDTKELTRAERRALRGEVRAIKKELNTISGGVYLSVGAILLIALLIILLA